MTVHKHTEKKILTVIAMKNEEAISANFKDSFIRVSFAMT